MSAQTNPSPTAKKRGAFLYGYHFHERDGIGLRRDWKLGHDFIVCPTDAGQRSFPIDEHWPRPSKFSNPRAQSPVPRKAEPTSCRNQAQARSQADSPIAMVSAALFA
jgi:hypothetical protein